MNANLPAGVTDRDIDGDRSLKLYTVEIVMRVTVPAHDDDEAINQAEIDLGEPSNARTVSTEVVDCEPL
jgi:hypothetical protein